MGQENWGQKRLPILTKNLKPQIQKKIWCVQGEEVAIGEGAIGDTEDLGSYY